MNRILRYSLLFVGGLVGLQLVPQLFGDAWATAFLAIRFATMVALAFIIIHVGYEFEVHAIVKKLLRGHPMQAGTAVQEAG